MSTTKKITELGEEEVPLDATDLAVVVTDVATTPTTKKTTLGTLRRYMLGIASVGTLVFPEQNVTLGTATAGSDAAAADVAVSVAPGTGYSTPARYIVRVPTMRTGVGEETTAQSLADALVLADVATNGGRWLAAYNPNGPLLGRFPLDASASVFVGTEGMVAGDVLSVIRAGNAANIIMTRVNGSVQSPSAILSGEVIGQFAANGYVDGAVQQGARVQIVATENWATGARGTLLRFGVRPIGSATARDVFDFSVDSATVGNLVMSLATTRFVVGATGVAFRNDTNTSDIFSLNNSGTTVLFPVATAFVVGADPGGNALARFGGDVMVNGNLLVGLTSALTNVVGNTPRVQVRGDTVGLSSISAFRNSADANGSAVFIGKSRAASAVQSGDVLGSVRYVGYDGTNYVDSALIRAEVVGTVSAGVVNGKLGFRIANGGTLATRAEISEPAAGETALWLYDADNATLERVTVGAADSGGAGFKVLRIPN